MRAKDLLELLTQLQPLTGYLSEAGAVLPTNHAWALRASSTRQRLLADLRRVAKGEGSLDLVAWRKQLDDLRRDYVQTYAALHGQYVLGPNEDDRRKRLLRDEPVGQLKLLSRIDILNNQEFKRWGQMLLDLPACREFHAGLLDASPTCPRCHFRPAQAANQPPAARRLQMLADQLPTVQEQWHAALRQNLQSDTARHSLQAMTAQERQPIQAYLAATDLDCPLPTGFFEVVNQALRGLETVDLSVEKLLAALREGGLPCTAEQLGQRFNNYLRATMSGHDALNTRLTLAQDEVD